MSKEELLLFSRPQSVNERVSYSIVILALELTYQIITQELRNLFVVIDFVIAIPRNMYFCMLLSDLSYTNDLQSSMSQMIRPPILHCFLETLCLQFVSSYMKMICVCSAQRKRSLLKLDERLAFLTRG